MAMNNRQRKVARSAIALPLIASLAFQAPLAQAQDTSKADGQRTIVQIKTKGLSPDAEFKLVDRNGEEFKKAAIGKNGAVTFLLDKSDSKKKLVGFQVDGKKYMTDTGKCKGANLLDPRNMPDSHISKAVEDAVKEKQAEQKNKEGDKSEEKTEKDNLQESTPVEKNPEAPGEGKESKTPSGEESAQGQDKDKENTPQGDKKEESKDEGKAEEKNSEGEKKDGNKTDESDTPVENKDEKPTDGSNTPVAKPKSLPISVEVSSGKREVLPLSYYPEEGVARFDESATDRDIAKAEEGLRNATLMALPAGMPEVSPDLIKWVMDMINTVGDAGVKRVAEFLVQNETPIKAAASVINSTSGLSKYLVQEIDKYYNGSFSLASLLSQFSPGVKQALDQFRGPYKQFTDQFVKTTGRSLPEGLKLLVELGQFMEQMPDGANLADMLFSVSSLGKDIKKNIDAGNKDDLRDLMAQLEKEGEAKDEKDRKRGIRRGPDGIPRNPDGSIQKDYYAELERIQRDEGVINQAVADSIAAGMSGRPVKMDVNDDTFDMYNLTKRDVVDCEFSFVPAVGVSDVDSSVQATGDGTVVATKKTGSSSSGSDFDIKNYFGEITTDKAVEEQRTVSRSASTGVKTQPVNKTQQEVGEGKTTYSTTNETLGRAGASVSGATGQTSVVTGQAGISQIPATAVSYGKKTGPRVDTGGQVEVPWWKKVATLFVG